MTLLSADNALSIRLKQGYRWSEIFQLNRESFSGLNIMVITTFEKERRITLVCTGLDDGGRRDLDVLEALKSGLMELVESGKEDVITFSPTEPPQLGHMEVPSKFSPRDNEVRARLDTNTTSELWKAALQPGTTYELRLSQSNGEAWGYYSDEHDGPHEEVSPLHRLPVGREEGTIRFTVDDYPAPLRLFAKLEMIPSECHLSGNPPFQIFIAFTTDSDEPITINKSRTPLSVFLFDFHGVGDLIYCEDTETGNEVEWPAAFGCFDFDPHPPFPDDDDFVEILSGKPWRFEHTLGTDTTAENGIGGLEELESGKTYKAQIAIKNLGGFSNWIFGRKKDLLQGSLEEKKRRWEIDQVKTGSLRMEAQGEPVVFKVVE